MAVAVKLIEIVNGYHNLFKRRALENLHSRPKQSFERELRLIAPVVQPIGIACEHDC